MKLQEEVNEFIEDKNLEELADAKETKQEGEDIYEVKKSLGNIDNTKFLRLYVLLLFDCSL